MKNQVKGLIGKDEDLQFIMEIVNQRQLLRHQTNGTNNIKKVLEPL